MIDCETCLDIARDLRDNWRNEIPEQMQHSSADGNRYKCRKTWFNAVYTIVWFAIELGYVDRKVERLYNQFVNYQNFKGFGEQKRTNEFDIKMADIVLTRVIGELEKNLKCPNKI